MLDGFGNTSQIESGKLRIKAQISKLTGLTVRRQFNQQSEEEILTRRHKLTALAAFFQLAARSYWKIFSPGSGS
jgi:GGDEF domain-containing protein